MKTVGVILFPEFELLDVFGPCEAYGILPDSFKLTIVAQNRGPVKSAQGPEVIAEHDFKSAPQLDILLVPGGMGTRREIENPTILEFLKTRASQAEYVSSVCTGAGVFARAGLLD